MNITPWNWCSRGLYLSEHFAQFNETAIQDVDLCHTCSIIDLMGEQQSIRQSEHLDRLAIRVYDPIFPDPGPPVQPQFHLPMSWGTLS